MHNPALLCAHLHPTLGIAIEPLSILRRQLTKPFGPESELTFTLRPGAEAGSTLRLLRAEQVGTKNSERN
jgi:hypothetical protein